MIMKNTKCKRMCFPLNLQLSNSNSPQQYVLKCSLKWTMVSIIYLYKNFLAENTEVAFSPAPSPLKE